MKKNMVKDLNIENVSAGLIAGAFGCTGSALLVIQAGSKMGLDRTAIVSWLFGVYVFGGILGIILSLKYRMPISGAYTIAGTVLLLESDIVFSLNELVFAYIVAGLIIFLVGITGIKEKIMKFIPFEIIMAMVSGVLLKVSLGLSKTFMDEALLVFVVVLSFIIFTRINKSIPAILSSLILGILLVVVFNKINYTDEIIKFISPRLVRPKINLQAILSISIPLSVLILGSENSQAIGVLKANGYNPPINKMTIYSGLAMILGALFGGHAVNIAGPMTAICSSDEAGDRDKRYMASLVNGIIFVLFGLFSSYTLYFVNILPRALINIIAVLALLGVLSNSIRNAFNNKKLKNSVIFTFFIAMMDISFLNIGAAIWALIFGSFIYYLSEKNQISVEK